MNIYLTSFVRHIREHIKTNVTFITKIAQPSGVDILTCHIKEKDARLLAKSTYLKRNVPLFPETQAWLKRYYGYIADTNQYLHYNNQTGLWEIHQNNKRFVNLLVDYFTILDEEARRIGDPITACYAQHFFAQTNLNDLIRKLEQSVFFTYKSLDDVISRTESLIYFETVDNRQALLDLSKQTWSMRKVDFKETQPMMLLVKQTQALSTDPSDKPTLFLSLIEDYMCHDPELIEYFHKVLAYMMSPYNYNQVVLHFYGAQGKNGKSTVVKVIQDILGARTARVSDQFLAAKPRLDFKPDDTVATLNGKSLIIFNEIEERMFLSAKTFKKLSDGGRDSQGNKTYEYVRPAFRPSYQVCIQGIPVILSNDLLAFPEGTSIEPILRRLIIIPFSFLIEKEDTTIADRLAAEYPQIQLWLYQNYFKYRNINLKTEKKPAAIENILNEYSKHLDSLGTFLDLCFEVDANTENPSRILRSDLYRIYQAYNRYNGRHSLGNNGLNGFQKLIKPYLNKRLHADWLFNSGGVFYIRGLKITEFTRKEILFCADEATKERCR